MTTILHITASIRGEDSLSRSLSQQLTDKLIEKGGRVIGRDLALNNLPLITQESFSAAGTAKAERTDKQAVLADLADTLIEELQQADILVLGLPIYNFGAPSSFKAWADLVARAGTTFKYTENGPVVPSCTS